MIKKNNLFDVKKDKKKYNLRNNNDKFNLFNEDNNRYNNSMTSISGLSNIIPNKILIGDLSNKNSKIAKANKKVKDDKDDKIQNILFSNYNKKYDEDLNHNKKKSNYHKNISYDKYFNINDLDLLKNKIKNKTSRERSKDRINNSGLLIYTNNKKEKNKKILFNNNSKIKNNEIESQKDEVFILLDNIKNKYKNQENKYINQQINMKNEIEILREQLKKLSVNEALYQVEIEKLKRKNSKNNIEKENNSQNLKLKLNHNLFNDINNNNNIQSNEIVFEQKLDNIIQKNKNQNNNKNLSSFLNNKIENNKYDKLLEIFNIDKNMLVGETITGEDDDINYNDIFSKYPQLKQFIQILVKKYNNEKEYRIRLEEKTVEIFTNDMKTINILEKKLKKYEANRQFRINSSLNLSSDGGLSDNNITKNSCKSCDKVI